jgi:hypothetical protein|tara:strand:- start:883 stop:1071 length:189 start_codon:yes stop_codon:yes gene_type:complete
MSIKCCKTPRYKIEIKSLYAAICRGCGNAIFENQKVWRERIDFNPTKKKREQDGVWTDHQED